jgi:hypothetical protein
MGFDYAQPDNWKGVAHFIVVECCTWLVCGLLNTYDAPVMDVLDCTEWRTPLHCVFLFWMLF